MRILLLASGLAFGLIGAARAVPFELKIHKVKIDFDGMQMDQLFFADGDKVILFAQPPNWNMISGQNSLTIKDTKIPSANIEVTFRAPFSAKNPKDLENEIIADVTGDLAAEGGIETKYEAFQLRPPNSVQAQAVILTYRKFGKLNTRGALYVNLTKDDVLKIRIGVPPESMEATMKAVKRWASSFKPDTRKHLEKMVREGYQP